MGEKLERGALIDFQPDPEANVKILNRMVFPIMAIVPTLFLLLFAAPAWGQMKMEIFPLKHRQAAELIPIVEPLLGGVGKITGIRDQLVVRSTPANLAMVRKLLHNLDAPAINLRITVKEGTRLDLQQNDAEVSADVRLGGKGRVAVTPSSPRRGGLTIIHSDNDSEVTARVQQRNLSEQANRSQQVVTLEGQPATIHITQSIPFKSKGSVVFREVSRGFNVLPQLQVDRVVLEISPVSSDSSDGSIESHGIHTTVSGRLGEWIELGGLSENTQSVDTEILGRSTASAQEKRKVFVKVEKER